MNIDDFYCELEILFQNNNLDMVKEYLDKVRKEAIESRELSNELMVLNESIGFYKSVGIDKEVEELESAVLNRYEEALPFYELMVAGKEYYLLSIYSTISNVLAKREEFHKSSEMIKKSIEVLERYEGTENEVATAYTNLAVNCLRIAETELAQEYILNAISIYEQLRDKPEGYGIALSGLAEVYYMKKEYINAISTYRSALDEIKRCYGETPIYAHALENCAKMCFDAGYEEDAQALLEHAKSITF